MRTTLAQLTLLAGFACSTGCGAHLSSNEGEVRAAVQAYQAASSAGDAGAVAGAAGAAGSAKMARYAGRAIDAGCVQVSGDLDAAATGAAGGVNLTLTLDGCSAAGGGSLSGSMTLHTVAGGSGTQVVVTESLTEVMGDGSSVVVSGTDPNQPTFSLDVQGSASAGQIDTTVGAQEHVVQKNKDGTVAMVLDVSLAGLDVVDTYVGDAMTTRQLDGVAAVSSSSAGFTASQKLVAVRQMPSCCYPVAGSIEQTVTYGGSRAGTMARTYTFTATCGQVQVDTTAASGDIGGTGTATLTLDPC